MACLDPQTILCKYFAAGKCKRPDCYYSHDAVKSQPGTVCRYYQMGICFYEDQCRFQHIPLKPDDESLNVEQAPVSVPVVITSAAPAPETTPPVQQREGPKTRNSIQAATASSAAKAAKAGRAVVDSQGHGPKCQRKSSKRSRAGTEGNATGNVELSTANVLKRANLPPLCPIAQARTCCLIDCPFRHGDYCDICECLVLDPHDAEQRTEHQESCLAKFEKDMETAFTRQKSDDLQCNVCLDIVMKQADLAKRRFGVLDGCMHVFCFSCIMAWRKQSTEEAEVVKRNRTCPTCRVHSHFVFPAKVFPFTKAEKDTFMAEVKEAIKKKPCVKFNRGKGKCLFGNQCWYQHADEKGVIIQLPPPARRTRRVRGPGLLINAAHVAAFPIGADILANILMDFSDNSDAGSFFEDVAGAFQDMDEDYGAWGPEDHDQEIWVDEEQD